MDHVTEWVSNAQNGDAAAFTRLVRQYQDIAVGYGYSVLGDFQLAEDAAQEAFVQAYRDLHRLREPAAFPGWLRRIVFKFCDRARRKRHVATIPLDETIHPPSFDPNPEDAVLRKELRERIAAEIARLPEHERTATTLYHIGGYTQQEVADFLNVPLNTVKTRLRRARQHLSERMIDMVRDSLRDNAPSRNNAFLAKVNGEIAELRRLYDSGDAAAREKVVEAKSPDWRRNRFENPDIDAKTLSEYDARVVVAMDHGFAHWDKLDAYLNLQPSVQELIEAICANDLAAVKRILKEDPSAANPKRVDGYEPPSKSRVVSALNDCIPLFRLQQAVFQGEIPRGNDEYALAKTLLDAGADPDYFDGYVLAGAAGCGLIDMTRALLEAGAKVDGVDGDGLPLSCALGGGYTEVAELLAEWNPKLDLRFAAGLGDLEAVKSFFNADDSLKDGAGALGDLFGHEAKQRGESVHRLERTRENILYQAFSFACLNGRLEVARYLLERGADVNAMAPPDGGTALHDLTINDARLPMVRFLLENGADVNARDPRFNATPLGWARHHGSERIAALLIEHGATE
ncbi:MAG: sigma-70 family RNA polymerase sigma factor [Candidatus Poribacteria bacterium]|nr:sigma-70 family RNA polymerase sigma factor [Candidatus Poribacteria bacterium]